MSDVGACFLETERLRLVPLDAAHAEDLAAIYADPEVARYVGGGDLTAERTREQVASFARVWQTHGYGQTALVERASGRLVGRAGLHPFPAWDEVELGYVLSRDRWHRGLATEAAQAWLTWAWDHLAQDHLIAVIQPPNTPSIALAERLGFHLDRRDVAPWGGEVSIYRIDRPAVAPQVADVDRSLD